MKNLLILYILFSTFEGFCQDKNSFYALDAKMNQTTLDSSKYILWVHQTDSAKWQWDYYYTWGPLVKSTQYEDHDGTIQSGRFCRYNSQGFLDSTGIYNHGKKNGSFYKFKTYAGDSTVILFQNDYVEDSMVKSVDLTLERQNKQKTDTTGEKESEFPGGPAMWQSYLMKNLIYPERAQNKEIQGQVRISFMIDSNGNILDSYIQKSVEYSLDQEALKIIINSGKWVPSTKNGVAVNAYKVQPLNFRLEAH